MNCQILGCREEAPKEIIMHILYKGKTHHFRMCRTHHKLMTRHAGFWRIIDIKNRFLNVKFSVEALGTPAI